MDKELLDPLLRYHRTNKYKNEKTNNNFRWNYYRNTDESYRSIDNSSSIYLFIFYSYYYFHVGLPGILELESPLCFSFVKGGRP